MFVTEAPTSGNRAGMQLSPLTAPGVPDPSLTDADLHFFSCGNRNYCLDVNSMTVFAVDEAGCNGLREFSRAGGRLADNCGRNETANREATEEIAELSENGFFAGNTKKARLAEHPDRCRVDLLGLSLFVMGGCNLACRYCFNDGGVLPAQEPVRMPIEVAERSVDFLLQNGSGEVGIDFFGGEPLLNLPLIKHVVDYANKSGRDLQYSLITNGTILDDDILDFLARNHLHVVVSYDGHLQDVARPARNGTPQREIVRNNIRRLAAVLPRRDISIRCILTHALKDLGPLVVEAKELGVRLLFGPVTLPADDELNLTADDLAAVCALEERVLWAALESGKVDTLTGVTSVGNTILSVMAGRQRYYSCGLGKEILGVSASGEIYPCHRFIGMPEFRMGNVFDGLDLDLHRRYADRYVDNRESCSTCWARYFCGGGCAHEAWTYSGDAAQVVKSRCELIRFETELGLKLYVTAFEEHPDQLDSLAASVEVRQFDNVRSTREATT